MANNRKKGADGENIARAYLLNKGYKILAMNYRNRFGEVDIIAEINEYIVFIEVKYRRNFINGHPREAVTLHKQNQIKKISLNYIAENDIVNVCFRYDVIEVIGSTEFRVEHIENAFY